MTSPDEYEKAHNEEFGQAEREKTSTEIADAAAEYSTPQSRAETEIINGKFQILYLSLEARRFGLDKLSESQIDSLNKKVVHYLRSIVNYNQEYRISCGKNHPDSESAGDLAGKLFNDLAYKESAGVLEGMVKEEIADSFPVGDENTGRTSRGKTNAYIRAHNMEFAEARVEMDITSAKNKIMNLAITARRNGLNTLTPEKITEIKVKVRHCMDLLDRANGAYQDMFSQSSPDFESAMMLGEKLFYDLNSDKK
jgi:hypothetical protein